MLIIVIGYLYVVCVIGIVAIVGGHVASGVFTLLFAGLLPTFLWLKLNRRKRLNDRARAAEAESDDAGFSIAVEMPSSNSEFDKSGGGQKP
ncbi:hypothetical protein FNU76_15350 [Chitinimonas arctica]|uniref:Uncharacterized protein n=1 Tax=Chitinimonas arctica TaxID=2594795 RepID=A0A516SHH7_9NEIS|nr:hypothetical protein [Chitinimonas arctica]QDQ27614.1 hypothetical protein FNU76_15350 [Chitinimonas arctica]